MPRPVTRVLAAGAAGIVCLGLAQSPASAAPAFTETIAHYSLGSGYSGDCAATTPALTAPPDVPVPENGATVPLSASGTRTFQKNGDASDKVTTAVSVTGSTRVTGAGKTPKSIEVNLKGTASATTSKSTSACSASTSAYATTRFDFTTSRPLIATLSYDRTGPMFTEAYIYVSGGDPYEDLYGSHFAASATSRVYLPAGHYKGYVEGGINMNSVTRTTKAAGSSTTRIDFVVPGSTAVAPKGKARKQVTLPAARNCAAHTVNPALTTKAKKLKKAKKVTFSVNGKKQATLKGKKLKKGKAVAIKVADKSPAKLGVTVKLKNGKKVTASATYQPCA